MREFSPPVAPILRLTVIELVDQIITLAPKVKQQFGRDLAMDNEDELVSESAKVNLSEGVGQVAVARSEAIARPPFEWLVEVTSQINETDYLKHYLVRENDIVLAHRKVLTEVDDTEAEQLIRDLKQTLLALG
jgi:hypothetical protein